MFNTPHDPRRRHFGFGFFGPNRRWADAEPPPDWPFGRFGRRWGFGGFNGGQNERFFGRGDLKVVILELLKDQPRHGYDIIRALEDRMRGYYRPSPGSVYPTLQMLEDLGYVTSNQQDGKKVYSITDEGRRYLSEQQPTIDDIRSRITAGWDAAQRPEVADLMHELQQLARALFRHGTRGTLQDPERLKQLREILSRARNEVDNLAERPAASPTPPTGAPPSEPRMV
ncbi:MAG TPA: PadR family transcriptional regulator [Chloroflexota bacterium]|jgi:DNA-binding PadR family transcriptional regulator|nr:PadR family transcriptional regulator [Chloroflexota bacterium]